MFITRANLDRYRASRQARPKDFAQVYKEAKEDGLLFQLGSGRRVLAVTRIISGLGEIYDTEYGNGYLIDSFF